MITPGFNNFVASDGTCMSLSKSSDLPSGNMHCNGARLVTITVLNGTPPYIYATTGGTLDPVGPTMSTTSELTPPANPGSSELGTAYTRSGTHYQGPSGGLCTCAGGVENHKCDDSVINCTEGGCGSGCTAPMISSGSDAPCTTWGGTCAALPNTGTASACDAMAADGSLGVITDTRTAPMIAAGCNPCLLALFGGVVVTVTDAIGQVAFITVDAEA